MRAKTDTQNRMDPGAPLIVGGGGPVLFVSVAEEYTRISGQALTEEEERIFADLVYKARAGELDAWDQFRVSLPAKSGAQPKDLVDTRRALTWEGVDGENRESAIGGQGIPGPGSAHVQCGHCRLRESQILPCASDILGGPDEMAALEP